MQTARGFSHPSKLAYREAERRLRDEFSRASVSSWKFERIPTSRESQILSNNDDPEELTLAAGRVTSYPVDYLEKYLVGKKLFFVLYSELVSCRHRDLDINRQLILCG